MCRHLEHTATICELTINSKKTVTLYQLPTEQTSIDPHVYIYGMQLKPDKNFTYLSSTVAFDKTVDAEINKHYKCCL